MDQNRLDAVKKLEALQKSAMKGTETAEPPAGANTGIPQ
jgi:hypothetical protein